MVIVPLRAVPNQTVTVALGGQRTQIDLYQKATGLFMDLLVSDAPVVTGVVCLDRCPVVRSVYLGFVGDLMIFDTQGTADPDSSGLGARWLLAYLTPADFA